MNKDLWKLKKDYHLNKNDVKLLLKLEYQSLKTNTVRVKLKKLNLIRKLKNY
jgi:hypothetical protein